MCSAEQVGRERERKKFSKIAMHEEGARKVRLQGDEDGLAICSIFMLHICSQKVGMNVERSGTTNELEGKGRDTQLATFLTY